MHLKIYFNDKPLFLCDAIDDEVEPYIHHDDAVFIDELDTHTIKSMIHEMQQEKIHAGVFYHPDLAELKKAFFKKFTLIEAGGGLVENEKGEVLLIFRRGKWDLPKGKLDPGETIEECALREVREETGLNELTITAPLLVTYHTYHQGARFILKPSHWFCMKAGGGQQLVPQTEEDIQEIRWVGRESMQPYLDESFPSIVDVLKTWLSK